MTVGHTVLSILLLGFAGMYISHIATDRGMWKVVSGLIALLMTVVAVWILFTGYAQTECEEIGWENGGVWAPLTSEVLCIDKVPFDEAEPKGSTK